MRRIRTVKALIIALVLSFVVLPVQALAAEGFVVCIDPGHGTYYYDSNGKRVVDKGAGNTDLGLYEAPVNMAIALACKEELEANGYTVVLTHESTYYYQGEIGSYYNAYTGTTLSDSSAGYNWANWKKAVSTAVNAGADFFFEIHCNSAGNVSANGAEAYYQYSKSDKLTCNYNNATCSAVSYRVATSVLSHLTSEVGLNNRGAKVTTRSNVKYPDGSYTDGYSWLILAREQNLPALLVEHAFMSNTGDCKILSSRTADIGKADAHAIMEALEADGTWTENETGRAFQKPDGSFACDEWVQILGFYYYFDENGNPVTGSATIDGVAYRFSDKGKLISDSAPLGVSTGLSGWQREGSKYYYYGNDGVRVTNAWQYYKGYWYYLGSDGAVVTNGWVNDGGNWYFVDGDGRAVTGWRKINGTWYYFESQSFKMLTNGWAQSSGKWYYLGSDGKLQSGWVLSGGKWYYLDPSSYAAVSGWKKFGNVWYHMDASSLAMDVGWKKIDGVWRYFNEDGSLLSNGIAPDGNKLYYLDGNAKLKSGWVKVDGEWYHFNEKTYAADMNAWAKANGEWYYLGSTGVMVTNSWVKSGSDWYYAGADGKLASGWLDWGGNRYYLDPTTRAMVDGTVVIGGKTYVFVDGVLQDSGEQGEQEEPEVPVPDDDYKSKYTEKYTPTGSGYLWHLSGDGLYYYEVNSSGATTGAWQWVEPIMGTSKTTVDAMVNAFAKRGVSYPSSVYSSKGASTIRQFCQILYEEATAEGVRAEVLFAQIMWETAWLQYGGDVKATQCNFGGIGATGGGEPGNTFSNVREGLRAQVQHLKAYGSTAALKNACVDPRFGYVTRGCIPYVQGLGIPDDPAGYGWAGGRLYGAQLVNLMRVYLGV